ncbi:similar to Saccharomyces cerevisiae YDR141C DOP1 Golgi-localized, leucine-zipper domain containing protein [Maudiozyma barnettii]|uniref:Similar to Saccharomyces cerevisiae YDR141C DOP1 Golgi-localized, leucine-zipper domain containing protein n=1 Tax=Maudiozyma barnettii TaxID=61262 RepID=A0A8H2VHR0_9SACH|nr:Dop1p [Kazachstania barnettii]CAB4255687.1 similar to Saccharomyces cerevisiae YDR141C DOP1 Golgi-localized, leucine-zipper domain containing protein [Kazachstania barnettii]CAD1784248.1 similar to Saccharomyces cerevisiae YDR141C DOP1 Golgi-localized, leucine-zipper domain containing protein [Kazachstania barnettii]
MSLQLKPLTIDSTDKHLDSKQKKFQSSISRALERFDTVTEWADYIASLGALLKALQSWKPQFQNVKYYVPTPYQVNRRLTSSLSPNLPAGVHQKTLEVYTYIFENIGIEMLAAEANIWIPGILPLMSFASMSVKSHLIDLYDTYLVQLPAPTLRMLVKPLIASLLPGIDDESSEFLPVTLNLIETMKENMADDSLFWQTCFLVIATSKDRRLGGLVWLMKKFPSVNAVPHLIKNKKKEDDIIPNNSSGNTSIDKAIEKKKLKEQVLQTLLPAAKDLVTPEPGLLVRCFFRCLDNDNDILIKRNILDLLLQRMHLNSPVITNLISNEDRKLLIFKCCTTTLNKDMSLNRRIWNWLLGSTSISQSNDSSSSLDGNPQPNQKINTNEYFINYGLEPLLDSLKDHISTKEDLVITFRICITFLDKWEIGSLIVPEMFILLLSATQKFADDENVIRTAASFFDAVETNIIWGKIFQYTKEEKNFDFLKFILTNFNIANDEEIIVRHLPLMMLSLLSYVNIKTMISDSQTKQVFEILNQLLEFTPERAFLPVSHSTIIYDESSTPKYSINKIEIFYEDVLNPEQSDSDISGIDSDLPFSTEDITYLCLRNLHSIVIHSLKTNERINEIAEFFVKLFEVIPEQAENSHNDKLEVQNEELTQTLSEVTISISAQEDTNEILGIVNLYSKYLGNRINIMESIKLLNLIIHSLWGYMVISFKQQIAIKCLKSFERTIPRKYVASALASAFIHENDFTNKLNVVDLLWDQLDAHNELLDKPLELILDELFDRQNPNYLSVSKWVVSLLNAGSSNQLYQMLTSEILKFSFINKDSLDQFDDLEMFTYKIRILSAVLNISECSIIENFSTEMTSISSVEAWKNDDISTYKNLMVAISLRFLNLQNNTDTKSIRSILILLDLLLDGTESNFKDIVVMSLQMSSKYISEGGVDSELIAVSLLDIVSKVLKLSHDNGIKLDIFDDNSTHLKYIDFLVTSLSSMNTPLIISSYVKILTESLVYFGESIFHVLLPLTASIIQCLARLFALEKEKGGYYKPIALLLEGLENLLETAHGYLYSQDKNGLSSGGTNQRSDFLQSVVSNVFYTENTEDTVRSQGERNVVLQTFKQISLCCTEVWFWAHNLSIDRALSTKYHSSYKFKFKTKKLLEKMFFLEPLETLENLVAHEDKDVITLIHVLDGNKPSLTIPYLLYSVILRFDIHTTIKFSFNSGKFNTSRISKNEPSLLNKLDSSTIMKFIIQYTVSLENSAIEEFYDDFITFFKEVSTNYTLFKSIYLEIIDFVGTVATKLALSQVADQKRYRKEVSDLFMRYIPNILVDTTPYDKEIEKNIYTSMSTLVTNTESVVNDPIGGDKFNAVVSTIVSQYLSPKFKSKELLVDENILSLALKVTEVGSKVKNWKLLMDETFVDDKKFLSFGKNVTWRDIIYQWSTYPENKTKLLSELLLVTGSKKTGMTPSLIPFNSWSNSETNARSQNLKKISYLLLISPKDTYLVDFQSLFSCVHQYLVSDENQLKSNSWILLRALFLTFNTSHFNEYWSKIAYCLQVNLQRFYEYLQIQKEIDSNEVLQICKTLDLLLSLGLEGFSATNEWIFIIDTINCIHRNAPFVALVDKIAEFKDFENSRTEDFELSTSGTLRIPLLMGVHKIQHYTQLRIFFHQLSYEHYESIYGMKGMDIESCKDDIFDDIFN